MLRREARVSRSGFMPGSFGIRVCVSPLIVDTLAFNVVDHHADRANPLELLI